jgi:hypothetical protein
MILAIPSMTQRCVSILLDRTRDFTTADLQAEKLISLGKPAANLNVSNTSSFPSPLAPKVRKNRFNYRQAQSIALRTLSPAG